MKYMRWTLSLLVLAVICVDAAAQEHSWRSAERSNALGDSQYSSFLPVVRKVEHLESVSYRVGFTLAAGEFHKLSEECLRLGRVEDFKALLRDQNPIVRVMGLICLAQSIDSDEFGETAKTLYMDGALVKYTNGCILDQSATVGTIAKLLVEKRFFLAPEDKQTPIDEWLRPPSNKLLHLTPR